MNTKRMPGFSAEASFYRSRTHYRVSAILAGLSQGGEVVPSLPFFDFPGPGVDHCARTDVAWCCCWLRESGTGGCECEWV
jgi:hypothetical protein